MEGAETELEMVQRHVWQGELCLDQQRAIIARLKERGSPTDGAERLLTSFEDIQRLHCEHLARLRAH